MYYYNQEGFDFLNTFISNSLFSRIVIIDDQNTHQHCLPILSGRLKHKHTNITLSVGDENKNIKTLMLIWDNLLKLNADRDTLIINLGGGMVTDIGGFAASTYKRGIKFIHVPTSLLGMVDAAIGGKNGINYQNAKNQIGTINPPEFVLIDDIFLKTLPKKEIDSGYAEMLKHGLIADKIYWEQLTNSDFKKNMPDLIKKSVMIKNSIITKDPNEKGLRKILNFGHTLGHAIESYLNYQKKQNISHGHAIALGMILATYISHHKKNMELTEVNSIKRILVSKFKRIRFSPTDVNEIIKFLRFDKKNTEGTPGFVLLKTIGKALYDFKVPETLIKEAFEYYSA